MQITLERQPGVFGVARLPARDPVPSWMAGSFTTVSRSEQELSIVTEYHDIPSHVRHEGPFALWRVRGSIDFSVVGVLSGICCALADAAIPVLAISTFNTDYMLVPLAQSDGAGQAWRASGFTTG